MDKPAIKIVKLIIKNFRAIGNVPLEIDLDDIVVLVGPNNSGKSTILKAFEKITKNNLNFTIDDFFNRDKNNLPEFEIWSEVGEQDIHVDSKLWIEGNIIKEKWIVKYESDVTISCDRYGYNVADQKWTDENSKPKAPFAKDEVAKSYRPCPTYITPFNQPEEQIKEIKKLISDTIFYPIINKISEGEEFRKVIELTKNLQTLMRNEADNAEKGFIEDLNATLDPLFGNQEININTGNGGIDPFSNFGNSNDIVLTFGKLPISNQGGGYQRALLWSILKIVTEKNNIKTKSKKEIKSSLKDENLPIEFRTNILLIDEPEICLHPNAIRNAKNVLYDLASKKNWQVMLTTHSPIFIDPTENNTSIIRIDKLESGNTTTYKSKNAQLSEVDKENLKILNIFDPYFAEFFFAKNIIVVEGDTEYSCFREIINSSQDKYPDIHIIRARGKYPILAIIKILTAWKKPFSVLHDLDNELLLGGKKNPAWAANDQILKLINEKRNEGINIKYSRSVENFEIAFFGKVTTSDKPFIAIKEMRSNKTIGENLTNVLNFLAGIDENYKGTGLDIK